MNHLTLEQCQNLEELGFPQNAYLWYHLRDGKEIVFGEKNDVVLKASEDVGFPVTLIACPTLEDLIEWLGQSFISLHRAVMSYLAYGINFNKPEKTSEEQGYGETPLEAVYNLCIAIKQPKN